MDRTEAVYKLLKESAEPLKAGQIVEASGFDKNEVDKALKKLKEEGKITSPKRCFWSAV